MNTSIDFERRAAVWLADGPTELADRVLEAALREVQLTQQRHRRSAAPWRNSSMSLRFGLIAAVALAVTAFGATLLMGGGGPAPIARPSTTAAPTATRVPPPTAAPTVAPSPAGEPVSFTSPLYRYTFNVPAGWAVTAATVAWPEGRTFSGQYWDLFAGPQASPDFDDVVVASQFVPEGMTEGEWLLRHAEQQAASGRDCKGAVEDWTEAVVGELTVRRLELECEGIRLSDIAFVVENRGHAMSGNRDAIALFLSTFEHGEFFGVPRPTPYQPG